MPTSNGLVTARDIRQNAVKTLHLLDSAVATDKIEDLAVTLEKNDAVVDYAFASDATANETITTTRTTFCSVAIDIPAWAGRIAVVSDFTVQISGGASQNLIVNAAAATDGTSSTELGGWQMSISSGSTFVLTDLDFDLFDLPGSTIDVSGQAFVNTGTNTSNQMKLEVLALFAR